MQLENSFSVPVPVDEAWRVLLDFERIAPCMPGAELDSVAGNDVTGTIKVKLGPINLTFQGKAALTSKDDAAHRAVIDARGKDQRGNGTAAALITATLTPAGTGTRVDVVTDLTITGRPAQFGRGVMTDVGNKMLGQFADKLAVQLAQGGAPAATRPPGPVAKAAATATGAVEEIAASVEQVPGDGAAATAVKKAAAATKKAAAGKKAAPAKAAPAKAAPAKAAPAKATPAKAVPAKAAPAKKAGKATPARDSVPAGAKRPSGPPAGPSAPPARPATGAPVRSTPPTAARTTPPTQPASVARPEPIDLLEVAGASSPGRYAPAVGAAAAVLAVVLLVRRRRRRS